ncbi:MAG: hypothetical protein ACI8W3_000088 [Myxococcota bacterium]|jgi:hypothetical protein
MTNARALAQTIIETTTAMALSEWQAGAPWLDESWFSKSRRYRNRTRFSGPQGAALRSRYVAVGI